MALDLERYEWQCYLANKSKSCDCTKARASRPPPRLVQEAFMPPLHVSVL